MLKKKELTKKKVVKKELVKKELKSIKTVKTPKKRNLNLRKYKISRKSFRARRFWAPRVLYRKRKFSSLKKIKEAVIKNYGITKPRAASLFVKHKRRNTFLSLTRKVRNKAKDKFGRLTNNPQFLVANAMSMGHLKIYKGRAKKRSVALRALSHVWWKRLKN